MVAQVASTHEMDKQDIEALIDSYGVSTQNVREAGYAA